MFGIVSEAGWKICPPPALGAARNENNKCWKKICPLRADSDAMASCPATVGQAAPVWPPLSPASLPPSPHATSSSGSSCRCPPKSTDRSRLPPRAQCSGSNLLSWAMAARVREELMLAGRMFPPRSSVSTPERGELQRAQGVSSFEEGSPISFQVLQRM